MSTTTPTAPSIERIRGAVGGRVIGPDDADYEAARQIMYAGVDHHPAVIVRVADASDVVAVIAIARETGAELAVRSGGHSAAGHSSTDGGIVIDVRDLDGLDIDIPARTAWAGSGLTAGAYSSAAADHGLATGFGDTGSVGIGGITLGGGVGYLVRKYGLTIDNLLAAEIVTADGQVRTVDATSDPDLFWAIRGGGGNFGVVTRFQFRLHELDGVVGGMLILPATAETVAGFIAAAEAAPDELSTIANVMPCPPMPFVPEEHHGSLVVFGMLAYAGDAAAGERALAPFRALAEPLADMLKPDPLPRDVPARRSRLPPDRGGPDDVHRPRRPTDGRDDHGIPDRVRRGDAGRPAAGPRRRRRHACRSMRPRTPIGRRGSWSTSPRSTKAMTTSRVARRGWPSSPPRSTRVTPAPT